MKRFLTAAFVAIIITGCSGKDPVSELADKVFTLAQQQYTDMDASLQEGEYPRTTHKDGTLRTSDMGW